MDNILNVRCARDEAEQLTTLKCDGNGDYYPLQSAGGAEWCASPLDGWRVGGQCSKYVDDVESSFRYLVRFLLKPVLMPAVWTQIFIIISRTNPTLTTRQEGTYFGMRETSSAMPAEKTWYKIREMLLLNSILVKVVIIVKQKS